MGRAECRRRRRNRIQLNARPRPCAGRYRRSNRSKSHRSANAKDQMDRRPVMPRPAARAGAPGRQGRCVVLAGGEPGRPNAWRALPCGDRRRHKNGQNREATPGALRDKTAGVPSLARWPTAARGRLLLAVAGRRGRRNGRNLLPAHLRCAARIRACDDERDSAGPTPTLWPGSARLSGPRLRESAETF